MILFIDTATTGMWQWKKSTDDPTQPHLLRFSAILCRDIGIETPFSCILKTPPGVEIEPGAAEFHGITKAHADQAVMTAGELLDDILGQLSGARQIVAHSADSHRKVLEASLSRCGLPVPDWKGKWFCTMREATGIIGLRNPITGGLKWPTLGEAYQHFTHETLPEVARDPRMGGLTRAHAVRAIHERIKALSGALV